MIYRIKDPEAYKMIFENSNLVHFKQFILSMKLYGAKYFTDGFSRCQLLHQIITWINPHFVSRAK